MKKVWTFLITSGPQITVGLPDNPPLDYSGHGQLIWKVIATKERADAYLTGLQGLGVEVTRHTEEMTEEMLAEKRRLQGIPPDSQ